VSDWLHRAVRGTSVHLAPFPVDGGRLDPARDLAMDAVRRLASLGRAARESASLRVRQPLARIKVAVPAAVRGPEFDALLALLADETNVKVIDVVSSDEDLVRLRGKANFRTLGKRFGAEVKSVVAYVATLTREQLQALERGEPVSGPYPLLPEDVGVEREVVTDWPVASEGAYVVALDPTVTPALASEGLARELVSRIQRLRKEAGYDVATRISLSVTGNDPIVAAAREYQGYIAGETLARDIAVGSQLEHADRQESVIIDGQTAVLAVRQLGNGRTASGPERVDES
jgi:isoleucyl-tRNA synthetase